MTRPLNLKKFEKHLIVRPLRPDDWPSVVALEQRCLPGMETWAKEHFDSQLRSPDRTSFTNRDA